MRKAYWKALVEEVAYLRNMISEYSEMLDNDNEWIDDLANRLTEAEKENMKLQKKLKKAKKK